MYLSEQWFNVTNQVNKAFEEKPKPRKSLKYDLDNEPDEVDCSDYYYQEYSLHNDIHRYIYHFQLKYYLR